MAPQYHRLAGELVARLPRGEVARGVERTLRIAPSLSFIFARQKIW
jgi:hypothetical protein